MSVRTRQLVIPITPAEERALIEWAKRHERSPVGQVRWLLRDILHGLAATDVDLEPSSVAPELADERFTEPVA